LEFELCFNTYSRHIHRQQSAWVNQIAQLEFQSADESACHYGFHSYATFVDVEMVDRYSFIFSVKIWMYVSIYKVVVNVKLSYRCSDQVKMTVIVTCLERTQLMCATKDRNGNPYQNNLTRCSIKHFCRSLSMKIKRIETQIRFHFPYRNTRDETLFRYHNWMWW
jgi:hypothetical protein